MDRPPYAARTLVREFAVVLHRGDWGMSPVAAQLSYDSSDPYALTLSLCIHDRSVPWIFARALLSQGLITPTGDGDVHIWPDSDDDDHAVVAIELCAGRGAVVVEIQTEDATGFLTRTHTIVPPGHESQYCDLDATIALIRTAETN